MEKSKNPARIVSEVEYEHGLEPGSLASKKVSKFVSGVRREAILLLREAGMSWPEIGEVFQRNHTSVMRLIGRPRRSGAIPSGRKRKTQRRKSGQ